MSKEQITTIPYVRKCFYDTYANLPVAGIKQGDLGFATDRLVFYRWSGAAWQPVTFHCSSGIIGNRPAAADLPNGSLYFATDTLALSQVQAGAWADISTPSALSGLQADIPDVRSVIEGTIYLCLDTARKAVLTAGAWVYSFDASQFAYPAATLALFQANAGTGTMNNPGGINDNNVAAPVSADTIGHNAQVVFDIPVRIDQHRYYGEATNNEDGTFSIEYRDASGGWNVWVASLPTTLAVWSGLVGGGEVITDAIRIVCLSVDTAGWSRVGELEVYHS